MVPRFLTSKHRVVKPELPAGSLCLLDLLQLQGDQEEQVILKTGGIYPDSASRLSSLTALWIKGGLKGLPCAKASRLILTKSILTWHPACTAGGWQSLFWSSYSRTVKCCHS